MHVAASLLALLVAGADPAPVPAAESPAAESPAAEVPAAEAPADEAPATGVRLPLFNGRDLQGWHREGCEAEVVDGVIRITGGDGLLRTDHAYRNFVLELEWRALKAENYDSGIYFRAAPPPAGKPFPNKYQVNLKQGDEGNLIGQREGRSRGLVRPGQWNRFVLTATGPTAALEINGQPAWKVQGLDDVSGWLAIQVEVPLGGEFEFRNLHITELDHRPLLNGRDLTGWEPATESERECWRVEEEGVLACLGGKGPWLRSRQQFDDFNLRLEYKLPKGGNSGIYVRVPHDGNHHGAGSGVEVQLLDDADPRYKDLKPYQYCGSVYAVAPARQRVGRPAGEWNTFEVDCRGPRYRVVHNGVTIVDAAPEEFPELAQRRLEGYLGWQNHGSQVWLRNVRIAPPQ